MKEYGYLLDKILNLDKWQAVQDALAANTKMAIITVDYKGDPVTKHSACNEFCAKIRGNPALSGYCKKCDSRGGLESVRMNKAYAYRCHFDIVDIAIPIIVNNYYAGAVLAGQVRLEDSGVLEKIISLPEADSILADKDTGTLYSKLPVLTYSELSKAADLIYKICKYAVDESLAKNLLIDTYEKIYNAEFSSASIDTANSRTAQVGIKEILADAISGARASSDSQPINYAIKPAVEYINTHIAENVSIETLARICNVSAGYLSRLFTRETGCTVTEYRNKLKIRAACEMLENSDLSVAEISDSLGFSDPCYFNRVFKKYRNVTPAFYRKFKN